MKTPTFLQGAGLALALSLAGSALFALFTQLTGPEPALRLVIALTAAAYVLALLRGGRTRAGKVSTVLAWVAISGLSWILHPSLLVYLLVHIGMLWLVRCLYFYQSLLAALIDMGLQGLSLAAAIWALQQTGSVLVCLWSFFLVQALFVAIPPVGLRPLQSPVGSSGQTSGFARAQRSAEAALRRIC